MSTSNEKLEHFNDVFRELVIRSKFSLKDIAERSGISEGTLKNWKEREIRRPQRWADIIRVAAAIQLAIVETDRLLTLAKYPSFSECQAKLSDGQTPIPDREKVKEAIDKISSTKISFGRDSGDNYIKHITFRPPLQRPQRAEHFIGRERELADLLDNLQPGRIITLCGPGGIGKTALAAEALWQLAPNDQPPERFPDGILFHNFYYQPRVKKALEHIVRSFGEDPGTSPRDAALRTLAGRRALLILDGAEEADDLRQIVDIRNQCTVLITSRQRKDALSIRQDLSILPINDAVILLQAFGGQRATNSTTVQHISELVGQLPLAIRLVGRYLAQTDIDASEYLSWLKEAPLAALNRGERQEDSVSLLLERSLDQMSKLAPQALSIVGALALAPFAPEAIAFGLNVLSIESLNILGELVNYGFLLRREQNYEVSHALIYTYASLRLIPPMESILRVADYFDAFAEEHRLAYIDDLEKDIALHVEKIFEGYKIPDDPIRYHNMHFILYEDDVGSWY